MRDHTRTNKTQRGGRGGTAKQVQMSDRAKVLESRRKTPSVESTRRHVHARTRPKEVYRREQRGLNPYIPRG
jgi:hypothetical protein